MLPYGTTRPQWFKLLREKQFYNISDKYTKNTLFQNKSISQYTDRCKLLMLLYDDAHGLKIIKYILVYLVYKVSLELMINYPVSILGIYFPPFC